MVGAISTRAAEVRGLPFTRSYSLEEVGSASRGARLDFDPFGRVAVIREGIYAVLNDTLWLNLAEPESSGSVPMTNVIAARDGRFYYGGLASWGEAQLQTNGRFRGVPLVPANAPDWVRLAAFASVFSTDDGVYFVGASGAAFWDFRRKEARLFKHDRTTNAFRLGNQVYLSAFDRPLSRIDLQRNSIESAAGTELDHITVSNATNLDDSHALLALLDGRVVVYDGSQTRPWPAPIRGKLPGGISALQHLVDGDVAVGINGEGLFLFSPQGELLLALDTPDYRRITALANREPGVLWVATEDAVQKVLYRSALTAFSQRLGVTAAWPTVVRWEGRVFIMSGGSFYREIASTPGSPTHFELNPFQPPDGAWALAAAGSQMMVGGPNDVYSVQPDGSLRWVMAVRGLSHLAMPDSDHCYVMGHAECALLERRAGGWVEAAPRTGGISYPAVTHRVKDSVWIEMGGKVGRLWRDQTLHLDTFSNTAWTKRPWVNVGSVDNIVVLSGAPGERKFFDEDRGTWCEASALDQLLGRSPLWIARVARDETGTIWATHDEGVVRFTPRGNDYEIDAATLDLINDRYPVVQILSGTDVWISASQSLYHVERRWAQPTGNPAAPVVVSMADAGDRFEPLVGHAGVRSPLVLPFSNDHFSFRFYSGSDAWRRPPLYEYRLTEGEAWTSLAGPEIGLRGLHEGSYRLQVRQVVRHAEAGPTATLAFEILPPWQRTWQAYALAAVLGLLLLLGLIRWSSLLERQRSRMLEKVVHERTSQLEAAMAKLGEETRHKATLEERNRLANEIHDTVQQGLTGAIFQLDTTLKLPAMPREIRSRLDVVRNMVSYARQEVQHAVWDMESPLLEGSDLADALRNLTTFAGGGDTQLEVKVSGEAFPLERPVNHNLLRIAQEATTNACRHASANKVTIHLDYSDRAVALEVVDDGHGFNPDAVLHERIGHLGLRGIRTRVKRLGGELVIKSEPGRGTSIRVVVPGVPVPV